MNETNISQALTNSLEQFFTQNSIFCRKVDAERISILLWKGDNSSENPTYILKIANQKFLSLPRVDKNGQTYWKFKESLNEIEEKENHSNSPTPEVNPTTSSEAPKNQINLEELRKKYEAAKSDKQSKQNNQSE